jgi:hypothetical protein
VTSEIAIISTKLDAVLSALVSLDTDLRRVNSEAAVRQPEAAVRQPVSAESLYIPNAIVPEATSVHMTPSETVVVKNVEASRESLRRLRKNLVK